MDPNQPYSPSGPPGSPGQPPQPQGYGPAMGPGGGQQPQYQQPYQQPLPGSYPQQPDNRQTVMSGYNPYAYPGEYGPVAKPKRNTKPVFIMVGLLAVVLIIAVVALTMSGGSKTGTTNGQTSQTNQSNQQSSDSTTSNAGNDTLDRPDGQLDLTKRINSSQTLKAQTIKAKEKQQVNLSSGFSFMVNKTEDYASQNAATKAGDGKKFVVLTVVVGNRNQSSNISVSYLDFRLRDSNNQLVAGHIATNEILNNSLSNPSEIKPGEQINGKIVFEVAKNDTSWVLRHSETYQKTVDNTTFNVEGEIVSSLAGATVTPTPGTPPTPAAGTTPTPATPSAGN